MPAISESNRTILKQLESAFITIMSKKTVMPPEESNSVPLEEKAFELITFFLDPLNSAHLPTDFSTLKDSLLMHSYRALHACNMLTPDSFNLVLSSDNPIATTFAILILNKCLSTIKNGSVDNQSLVSIKNLLTSISSRSSRSVDLLALIQEPDTHRALILSILNRLISFDVTTPPPSISAYFDKKIDVFINALRALDKLSIFTPENIQSIFDRVIRHPDISELASAAYHLHRSGGFSGNQALEILNILLTAKDGLLSRARFIVCLSISGLLNDPVYLNTVVEKDNNDLLCIVTIFDTLAVVGIITDEVSAKTHLCHLLKYSNLSMMTAKSIEHLSHLLRPENPKSMSNWTFLLDNPNPRRDCLLERFTGYYDAGMLFNQTQYEQFLECSGMLSHYLLDDVMQNNTVEFMNPQHFDKIITLCREYTGDNPSLGMTSEQNQLLGIDRIRQYIQREIIEIGLYGEYIQETPTPTVSGNRNAFYQEASETLGALKLSSAAQPS